MNTMEMNINQDSNTHKARIAGWLYLVIIVLGLFAQLGVLERLIVSRNPEHTALNILNHEVLYRLGFVSHIMMLVCALLVMSLLYHLLQTVDKFIARLMVFFNLIAIAVEAVSLFYIYQALIYIKSDIYIDLFSPEQVQGLSYLSLSMQSIAYDLSLFFFAFFCLFCGYLIYKSRFIPRLFGILMILAGVCYFINSLIHFLSPEFSKQLLPYILIPCFIGEFSFCLWLIIRGIHSDSTSRELNT
jgi:hypothetical protein